MGKDKDERKRPQLRLVVDNAEKRTARPGEDEADFIPLDQLVARREGLRRDFYANIETWQTEVYQALEQYCQARGWEYGLDPYHGRMLVLAAGTVCPEAAGHDEGGQDEVLLYVADDVTGQGLCLSLEMIMPYWSEDDAVMEDALIYGPFFQYGAFFLEENRHDSLLDLIYRLSLPLYPAQPTAQYLDRLFAIAAVELREALANLAEAS